MTQPKHKISTHTFTKKTIKQISSGNYFTILFITRGFCHFDLEETIKSCGTEDIVLMKPQETATLQFRGGKQPLSIMKVSVLPSYLKELSDETARLEEDFQFIPYHVTIVHVESAQCMLLKNIAHKLQDLESDVGLYGHNLYEKSMFSILLLLSLRSCIHSDRLMKSRRKKNLLIDDIFIYIREHLSEELSLEQLEKEFFVSRYHICREFKTITGQSPHAYIVKARLDLCKTYIEEGIPINEVYQKGGFGGYNHFFRAFKKEYGMTPKEYYRSLQI